MLNKIVLLDQHNLGADLDFGLISQKWNLEVFDFTDPAEVVERARGASIIITNKVAINKEHLQALSPELKGICVCATGMNNIDLDAAKELGIQVLNAVGYSTQSVAEHTLGLYFSLAHRIRLFNEFILSEKYAEQNSFTCVQYPFDTISNKKWGVIGLGTIGKQVASYAQFLGADVCYYSTSGHNKDNENYPHWELEKLLRECDVISIHCPLNENTHHLLDLKKLKLLKDRCILINVARGSIIEEKALVDVMSCKKLFVGLDVFENEPLAKKSPLAALASNNHDIILTPHVAWAAKSAREQLLTITYQNIQSILV